MLGHVHGQDAQELSAKWILDLAGEQALTRRQRVSVREDDREAGEGRAKLSPCDVQVGVLEHERRPRIHPERLAAAQVEVDRQRDVGSRVYALLTGVVVRWAIPTQEAVSAGVRDRVEARPLPASSRCPRTRATHEPAPHTRGSHHRSQGRARPPARAPTVVDTRRPLRSRARGPPTSTTGHTRAARPREHARICHRGRG